MGIDDSRARIIVVSDRIIAGERGDKASPRATEMLEKAGFRVDPPVIVNEGYDAVAAALSQAVRDRIPLIITCGGTGAGARNLTPEATEELLAVRLQGLETQILFEGLKNSPQAGLSRGIVGLTSRGPDASLVVNAPSSSGGVHDSLAVILSVWPNIQEKLGR
ncbi:molybdopterin-binding protein [Corynebacterium breve]|uniref:Molybdopterin-binding protein n=1 Tax=Corynebacterium breve TaxID=3049799 RepID=A0ABY8VG39_9CORY|nr:molybdopterin-binding protein [Corynebacterium breve]WIM68621.1 molybdopterin-binding protein [Corynebacterium breve]